MNFHKDTGDSLEPCKHMEGMLNRTADGTAPKLMKWYAESHAAGCPRCGTFLKRVTTLIGELHDIKSENLESVEAERLSPAHWQSVEAGWSEAEK